MKKITSFFIAVVMLCSFAPFMASAQTANTAQVSNSALENLLTLLLQELALLQKEYAQLIQGQQVAPPAAQTNPSTPTVDQATPTVAPVQPSQSVTSYTAVDIDAYHENPAAYTGENIVILGVVDNFVPSNGGGGYVETYNPGDFTRPTPHVEMELLNEAGYTTAVNGLQVGTSSVVMAKFYGTGAQNQTFALTNGGQSIFPVVNVARIDRCVQGSLSGTVVIGSQLSSIATCSEWKTVFPSNMAGQITYTNTPTPQPLSTPSPVMPSPSTSPAVPPATPLATTTIGDATLSNLTVNGTQVSGFNASKLSYEVTLPSGVVTAPTVGATTDDPNAADTIVQATTLPGLATIVVTASNGMTTKTYTINFAVMNSLAGINSFSLAQSGSCPGITYNDPGQSLLVGRPMGTSLTNLKPQIVLYPYDTISPASGIAQDFTNPVTYTVTAGDETTTKTYVVTAINMLNSISPTSGLITGGTSVAITRDFVAGCGEPFTASTTVSIGGVPATNVSVSGDGNTITATTPQGSLGNANVVVINADGVSASLPNGFDYTNQ